VVLVACKRKVLRVGVSMCRYEVPRSKMTVLIVPLNESGFLGGQYDPEYLCGRRILGLGLCIWLVGGGVGIALRGGRRRKYVRFVTIFVRNRLLGYLYSIETLTI
jgi:hypothetical protein